MVKTAPNLTDIICHYRLELEKVGICCEQLLLFGSQAHGNAHEWSDIDVIVVSSDWSRYNRRERLEILGMAAGRIMQPVQGQGFTPEEIATHQLTTFWEYVLADAVPVAA